MSLIQFGEYISWKLPRKTHLVLSSNPDNGSYSVTTLDPAQKSRLLTFNVEFDVKPFAKWAEVTGMRGELINFALLQPELFDRSDVINARSYTIFANALKSIHDLSTPDALSMANLVAKGAFGDDGEYIGGLFVQFINNKLDKLITPEKMLHGDWEEVCKKLKENVYNGEQYRADIGSVLTLRFINYVENYFNNTSDKDSSDKTIKRIVKMVTYKDDHDRTLLTSDLILKLIKTLHYKFPRRFEKMISIPEIRNIIIGV